MSKQEFPNENILEDSHPVFWEYLYITDGKLALSSIQGTVADLKKKLGATEIRRCNILARRKEMEKYSTKDQHETYSKESETSQENHKLKGV